MCGFRDLGCEDVRFFVSYSKEGIQNWASCSFHIKRFSLYENIFNNENFLEEMLEICKHGMAFDRVNIQGF